jgi:hypothetical protein
MDVDVDDLARMLAGRMAAVVPAGFRVEAADGRLWYSAADGRFPGQLGDYRVGQAWTYVRDNFEAHGETAAERITGMAAQALDELQDYVDEATHDPWPGKQAPPRACAEIRGPLLHLWYGQPGTGGHVDLACEPIPLAAIHRRA